MTPKDFPSGGYAKDAVEIEGYLRGFARRRPDVSVTVLRFANLIGPRIDTVFTRYFALPVVPTVLGYDARVQLLHEEDALAVLERAASLELPGTFNVAADGVLLLSQAIRRAGRIAIPVPAPAVGAGQPDRPRRPPRRLLARADAPAQLRAGCGQPAAAHPVRLYPALDHHASLRRLRARPCAAPGDPARAGRIAGARRARCREGAAMKALR